MEFRILGPLEVLSDGQALDLGGPKQRAVLAMLLVEEGELDLDRFRRLREEGKLSEALSLWRGPPLSDFRYQRFAQAEIARLEELRLAYLEERVEHDLARGRHADLVGELDALVS